MRQCARRKNEMNNKNNNNKGKKTEFTFCRVCRINHNHGAKHKFHAKHKSHLESALRSESAKIAEFKSYASQRLTGGLFASQRWCVFCDKDTSTKDSAFSSALQHLGSKEHKKNVIEFLKEMGSNENRNKFYIQKGALKQFVSGDNNGNANDYTSVPPPSAASPVDMFAAVSKEDSEPKAPKTVISALGIKQNPTGWDAGERVWGGGIVKYKREGEWQPWPIDLDNESDAFDPSTLMGGAIIPGLLTPSSSSAQNNIAAVPSSVAPPAVSNGVFTHPSLASSTPKENKQTQFAYSADLARVDAVPLAVGQGNVHTGATPPWMVNQSGSAIPTITPFASLSERERRGKKNVRAVNGKKGRTKIGSNVDREKQAKQAQTPGWLPNFGSVWTAGPRSETRRNFDEKRPEKPTMRSTPSLSMDIGSQLAHKRKLHDM